MKKLLILALVLGMAALAQAGPVISVVTSGAGDAGNAGTSGDPLVAGEMIAVKVVLVDNPGSHSTSTYYDGYILSSMDLDLSVSAQGTIAEKGTTAPTRMKHHASFATWAEPEPAIASNGIAYFGGVGPTAGITSPYGDVDLVWNLEITAAGTGNITIDLGLNGTTSYSVAGGGELSWVNAVEGDLGDLTIYAVPEPITIALLGLGGLFLRRRK